jgi:hypothetical protein
MEVTLAAIEHHGWHVVLLAGRTKRPVPGQPWTTTTDLGRITKHVRAGSNIGLDCGPSSGVAVLDFDDLEAAKEINRLLGALDVTVVTGTGKVHCYVTYEPGLPGKIRWRGRPIGDVQRGGQTDRGPVRQHVVLPPSLHPDTGRAYHWAVNPVTWTPPPLPPAWRAYLLNVPPEHATDCPDYMRELIGDLRGVAPAEPWTGPTAEELIKRALKQVGAVRRSNGSVKMQCPQCAVEGHDRHRDNATVFADGRWGCAHAPGDREHRLAIGRVLGAIGPCA